MEVLVPWRDLIERIAPCYPEGRKGRPPLYLYTMLRVHFMQQWFTPEGRQMYFCVKVNGPLLDVAVCRSDRP